MLQMLRIFAGFMSVMFALASSSYAGNVQVNFSGGSGAPLSMAITYTVTSDTPNPVAAFVFLDVGNFLGGVTGANGSLSYTTNDGSALAINSARERVPRRGHDQ